MLIIVPRSKALHCGLEDHARVIKAEFEQIGVGVEILQWQAPLAVPTNSPILLEFTPLAYGRFGLSWPLLLHVALLRWKNCRVIIYFHELPFPNGAGVRRRLAVALQHAYCALLVAACNHAVVNQPKGLRWLKIFQAGDHLSFLPTCSNVGESHQAPAPAHRPLQVVVFGSPGKRRHAHAIVASHGGYRRLFGADVVVIDIGETMQLQNEILSEVSVLGPLPSDVIKRHLLASRFGFFYSQPDQFSKSGVFAAYCAHGVVPILAHGSLGQPAFFLTPEDLSTRSHRFLNPNSVWRSCRLWYRQFSSRACANRIYELAYES